MAPKSTKSASPSKGGGKGMPAFGGKKAAPFVTGGKRSSEAPRDAKGKARKK